jgi:lipopolysaccharide/colanic/teichoic acid biosynthesis glycosyltransferase
MYVPTSRSHKKIYMSVWDVFWALASPPIALYLGGAIVFTEQNWTMVAMYWALASAFAVISFLAFRLQDSISPHFSAHEALDIAEAVLFAELLTCGFLFTLTRLDGIPRSMPLIHGLLLGAGLIVARITARTSSLGGDGTVDYRSRSDRVILIGANPLATSFIRLLGAYAPNRQSVVAVLTEKSSMIGRALGGVQVLGTPQELDAIVGEFAVHGIKINRVIIAGESDLISPAAFHDVERVCKKRHIGLAFLPRMLGVTEQTASAVTVVGPTREEAEDVASGLGVYLRIKRSIDVVASLALIVLLLPIWLIATVLVLFDLGSPVLFWQERTGWKGRPFLIYKYRTLRAPFDDAGKPAVGDRQPSAIGRLLRATRIDELPQLINVLLGDMSLIGPRPLLPEDQPSNTALRLSVRPGISGWAQVNGAKLVTKEEKEALDEYYVRNASLWLDFKIVLLTLRMMSKSYLGSAETSADLQQVQAKRTKFAATGNDLPAPESAPVSLRQRPVTPVAQSEMAGRSAPTIEKVAARST